MKRFPHEINVSLKDSILIDEHFVDSVNEYHNIIRKFNIALHEIKKVSILEKDQKVVFILIESSPFGMTAEYWQGDQLVKMEKTSNWVMACEREKAEKVKTFYTTLAKLYGAKLRQ